MSTAKTKQWKRAPSAYNLFVSENFKELGSLKAASEKWRSLSEKDKAPFLQQAESFRRSFEKGNRVVRKSKNGDGKTNYELVTIDDEPPAPAPTKKVRAPKVSAPKASIPVEEPVSVPDTKPKAKRAPNVYQQYIARADVKEALAGLTPSERRAKLKEMWSEEKSSGRVQLRSGKQAHVVEGIANGQEIKHNADEELPPSITKPRLLRTDSVAIPPPLPQNEESDEEPTQHEEDEPEDQEEEDQGDESSEGEWM